MATTTKKRATKTPKPAKAKNRQIFASDEADQACYRKAKSDKLSAIDAAVPPLAAG